MATKTWKIEKDLCRCCHAEGTFDNLAEPRIFLEKEEVYSDMLRECLDIDIPPVPGELCAITYTICNSCIVRLRDACNFKKQVQDCEQRFMTLYYKNAIQGLKPATMVKEELDVLPGGHSDVETDILVLKKEDEDDAADFDMDDDDGLSDDEDDLPIKQTMSKTRPKPKPKPKAKPKPPPVGRKMKPPPKPKKKEETKPAKEKKGTYQRIRREVDYTIDQEKVKCIYCLKSFDKLSSIYSHVRRKHQNRWKDKKLIAMNREIRRGRDYKIDGDRYVCTRCGQSFEKNSTLYSHIRSKHFNIKKKQSSIKLVRIRRDKDYRMDPDGYMCAYCDQKYGEIKPLFTHIRENHYGRPKHVEGDQHELKHDLQHDQVFSIRTIENTHRVVLGRDFVLVGDRVRCNYCDITFNYRSRAIIYSHVRIRHYGISKYICKICDTGFKSEANFVTHKLKVHNLDERYLCTACEGKFNSRRTLVSHVKVFHMQGVKRKCPSCEYESYRICNIKRHMLKHSKEKNYVCRYCKKAFVRQATLYLHERIHTGDRRSVCKLCSKAFVQKASLNYHMKKYHPGEN